jgi:hypothetical protein
VGDGELAVATPGGPLLDVYLGDLCRRWADLAPGQECLHGILGPFGLQLDGPVAVVLHPADESEPPSFMCCRRTIGHTLDTPRDDRADAAHTQTIPHQ